MSVTQVTELVGCEQWRALVQKYDWDASIAMAVMEGESSCIADRVGDDYAIAGLHRVSCGLFQVRTLDDRPTCEQLKDPATNIEWAYKVYAGKGNWKPWTVFNTGEYKQFLR